MNYFQHNERTTPARPTTHYHVVFWRAIVRGLDRHLHGTTTMSAADIQRRRQQGLWLWAFKLAQDSNEHGEILVSAARMRVMLERLRALV
jgi:hypothetical protein